MPDLTDGQTVEIKGSAASPYIIKNVGGVYSCTCPAWRNQSLPPERRTCKHIRKYRGDAAETARLGAAEALPLLQQKPEGDAAAGPPVLLAETWDTLQDLTNWWMSEKLDGVRAYWDGKQFISRQGNLYHAPAWFIEGLPTIPLDGELWIGRKAFQRTVGIVRRQDKSDHWKEVRFLIFDAPALQGPFEKRLAFLEKEVMRLQLPFAQFHPHEQCQGADHLLEALTRVLDLGGEGLMFRQPQSHYVAGRSSTLLKVKKFHDAEATVIGHQAGSGKHKGRLGALLVQLADGTKFAVGTGFSDKERDKPPPLGSIITFRYQELSDAGVPRFPSYVAIRTDGKPASIPTHPILGVNDAASKKTPAKKTTPASMAKPQAKAVAKPKKAEVVVQPATTVAATASGRRHFELVGDGSSKFWEYAVDGSDLTTWWGKIGTEGQSKTKNFGTHEKALAEADKLVKEKTGKGYIEK